MSVQSLFYTSTEAATTLGITESQLSELSDYIPETLERNYIDDLAALLRIGQPQGYEVYDPMMIKLHALEQRWAENRKRVSKELRKLIVRGEILTIVQMHKTLDNIVTLATVFAWARKRQILTVCIGRKWYVSRSYASHLQMLFSWPSLRELSRTTHLPQSTILGRIKSGQYRAFRSPRGSYRIDPALPLNSNEVSTILGITTSRVRVLAKAGVIAGVWINGKPWFDRTIITALRKRLDTINNEFSWLQDQLSNQANQTLDNTQLSRKLGRTVPTIERWRKAGLLPFYNRSLGGSGKVFAAFPKRYVNGLLLYVSQKNLPIDDETLALYKMFCKNQGKIM